MCVARPGNRQWHACHARDQLVYLEAAADRDGLLLGLRARVIGNPGSFLYINTQPPPFRIHAMLPGCYKIPAYHAELVTTFTNTTTTGPYRGAGRPEATHNIERIIDPATLATPRSNLGAIEGVEVTQRDEAVLRLKEPSADPLNVTVTAKGPSPRPGALVPVGPFAVVGAQRQSGTIVVSGGPGNQRLLFVKRGSTEDLRPPDDERRPADRERRREPEVGQEKRTRGRPLDSFDQVYVPRFTSPPRLPRSGA